MTAPDQNQPPGVPVVPHSPPGPYPPQGYPPPGPYYPQPPVRRPSGFWSGPKGVLSIIAIALGGLFLICGLLFQIGMASDREATSNMEVTVTSCAFTGGTLPSATMGYTITNTGTAARSATVHIEYRDEAGNRVDTDTARVKSIAPGDTVRAEETTLLDAPVSGAGKCSVTGVS